MMDRRTFLCGLTLGTLAAPLVGEGQQARVYRVGVVLHGSPFSEAIDGLRDGLQELGLDEGKQFVFHVRETKGDLKLVEVAAKGLETERVDLIYSVTTGVTLAAKRATKSIPIVFYVGGDPVAAGLVESFRKPGGRLTGVHGQSIDLTAKRLELLKEMIPSLRRVVTFYGPDSLPAQQSVKMARVAAHHLKFELIERPVASIEELRAALRALRPGDADALFQLPDSMVNNQWQLVIDAAMAKRLPTMFTSGAVKGTLASYGVSYYACARLSAKQVQRVLLGADPGEMPVEQVDRLHFVINLKTAKALGLTIPPSVLARADQVIE